MGSEMCIRDSASISPDPGRRRRTPRRHPSRRHARRDPRRSGVDLGARASHSRLGLGGRAASLWPCHRRRDGSARASPCPHRRGPASARRIRHARAARRPALARRDVARGRRCPARLERACGQRRHRRRRCRARQDEDDGRSSGDGCPTRGHEDRPPARPAARIPDARVRATRGPMARRSDRARSRVDDRPAAPLTGQPGRPRYAMLAAWIPPSSSRACWP